MRLPGSSSREVAASMHRLVPSPREMPAQPAPLSKKFRVPLWSIRVTWLLHPRSKALPALTRQATPPRASSISPISSASTILPLKGT